MRNIDVPRNCNDRQTVSAWQGVRDGFTDIHAAINEYDVNIFVGNSDGPSIFVNISTTQDDYSPTGWSGARRVFLNVTASCNINGFDANASVRLKTIFHVGTNEIVLGLMEQKLSSAAANRIMTPSPNDVYMLKSWAQDIWYDTTVSRWRPV